jgi:hypothetical protein
LELSKKEIIPPTEEVVPSPPPRTKLALPAVDEPVKLIDPALVEEVGPVMVKRVELPAVALLIKLIPPP